MMRTCVVIWFYVSLSLKEKGKVHILEKKRGVGGGGGGFGGGGKEHAATRTDSKYGAQVNWLG